MTTLYLAAVPAQVLPPAAAQVQPLVECFFVLADVQVGCCWILVSLAGLFSAAAVKWQSGAGGVLLCAGRRPGQLLFAFVVCWRVCLFLAAAVKRQSTAAGACFRAGGRLGELCCSCAVTLLS